MEAMVIRQFGGPDVFEKANVARPQVYPGQVLIQVAATSVNPVDCKIRQGKLAAIAPEFPAVLHGDVAGVVVEVGDDRAVVAVVGVPDEARIDERRVHGLDALVDHDAALRVACAAKVEELARELERAVAR